MLAGRGSLVISALSLSGTSTNRSFQPWRTAATVASSFLFVRHVDERPTIVEGLEVHNENEVYEPIRIQREAAYMTNSEFVGKEMRYAASSHSRGC